MEGSEEPKKHRYSMSISLAVLNHLGIGLYSNVPAVLSEVVANSWDADAGLVDIRIDQESGSIEIEDDGEGMTEIELNERYLNVGYQRRTKQGSLTKKKRRHVMGRKGIGKLSVFSIAESVKVITAKNGACSGFSMSRSAIKDLIEQDPEATYHPEALRESQLDRRKGTLIRLSTLDKSLSWTEIYLRRRLARRFSVIGPANDFKVRINGAPITVNDRDFLKKLEFLWHFGPKGESVAKEVREIDRTRGAKDPNAPKAVLTKLESALETPEGSVFVEGWIGTVDLPESLDEANNSIVVLAHGKLVHEDILPEFNEAGVYADYVIGEINADFLDADDRSDIVTSARQSVKTDDPRYLALSKFVEQTLKKIKNQWSDLRRRRGAKAALGKNALLQRWYERHGSDTRKIAERMIGKIESLAIGDAESKAELYRASMLAFEKLALQDRLSVMDGLDTHADFDVVRRLLADVDEIEAIHYFEIIRSRLEVITKFVDLAPTSRERVLQEYIFEHLWLLDPSWERAATNARIEERVTTEFSDLDARLSREEREGRVDIRYRTAAGKHIVIELKKYDVRPSVSDLLTQLRKYRAALTKVLKSNFPTVPRVIEMICILGSPPSPVDDPETNEKILSQINARFVTYDSLIKNIVDGYGDFLEKERTVRSLVELLDEVAASLLQTDPSR